MKKNLYDHIANYLPDPVTNDLTKKIKRPGH